jgi:hypothetical protein
VKFWTPILAAGVILAVTSAAAHAATSNIPSDPGSNAGSSTSLLRTAASRPTRAHVTSRPSAKLRAARLRAARRRSANAVRELHLLPYDVLPRRIDHEPFCKLWGVTCNPAPHLSGSPGG